MEGRAVLRMRLLRFVVVVVVVVVGVFEDCVVPVVVGFAGTVLSSFSRVMAEWSFVFFME